MVHRIAVKRSWLERGELIELTLPRNLTCAACSGGGCDRCGRSGAISLRGRQEPPKVLTVPLPKRSAAEIAQEPVIVLRVPEQGGAPDPGSALPRGVLLLRISAASKSDAGIQRVKGGAGFSSRAPDRAPEHVIVAPPERSRTSVAAYGGRSWLRPALIGAALGALLALLLFLLRR